MVARFTVALVLALATTLSSALVLAQDAPPAEAPPAEAPPTEAPPAEAPSTDDAPSEAPAEPPASPTPPSSNGTVDLDAIPTPPAGTTAPPAQTPPATTPAAPIPPTTDPAQPNVNTPPGEEAGAPRQEMVAPEPPPEPERLKAIVIDAATYQIDPVVGRHVSAQIRQTAAEMGYEVLSEEVTIGAVQRLRMPYPPAPADLWRVTYVADSHRGVFARVWAHNGQYVVELSVASLDGTGPFFVRGAGGPANLREVVAGLVREVLPAADSWTDGAGILAQREEERRAAERREAQEQQVDLLGQREAEDESMRRFSVALQAEGAIGATDGGFYNQMVGVRLDYRVSRVILFGLYASYANLNAREGRANNVTFMAQLESRIRPASTSDITVPLRFGVGYVPFNGPLIRIAAGINIPLSERFELGFDILAPTFWILPTGTSISFNLAAELIFRL